ncbi:PC4-like protein [Stemphylium lycopersici]|uniref:PC4-like protein n=1 Tax=Stemphylium lycopersici TaxID=183478 RepID=A0A364MSD2_STELY|nr:PC4-like protein [Stemphylium lycopersici]
MGYGKSILLSLRVLALIIALGVAGLGAWTKSIVRDIEVRGNAVVDDVEPESQEMKQLWRQFFATVLDEEVKIWISIGSAAFASLVGIFIVLATILPRMRISFALLIPMECLCMCAMGAALGVSLSFTLDLDTFSKNRLDAGTSPELTTFSMVVDLSRGYAISAGAGWFLFLVTFIMATIDACSRAREKESCSFEPTASALGMAHGYAAIVPPPSRSHVPTMYDPQVPLDLSDANAVAWTDAQGKESAGFKRGGARGGGIKKAFTKKRSSPEDDDNAPCATKKAKGDEEDDSLPVVPELKTDDNGDTYVGLNTSGKRRVTVSDFNKSTLVSIREYYVTDAGETRPGKKGISLTIDQYNTLLAAAPLIETALAKKDIKVVRPDYDASVSAKSETEKEEDKDDEEEKETKKEEDEDDEEHEE